MKKKIVYVTAAEERPRSVVQEIEMMPGIGGTISVRAAKAHLSGLLDWVAEGREVIVTSGGKPKARITPLSSDSHRRAFTGTRTHLASMPQWKGRLTADELVREDRDARG